MNKQELEALAMQEIPALEEKVMHGLERLAPFSQIQREIAWGLGQELKEYHLLKYAHSLRVALKTVEILDFTHFRPRTGLYGGLLHDIGVIKIPIEILDKAWGIGNQYTPKDHEIMKTHVKHGYEICLENGLLMTAWIAFTHHCFDIKDPYPAESELPPYPKEFASFGARLNLMFNSRIGSIADKYDAHHRPNIPLTLEQIKQEMLAKNPDQEHLISELYKHGVFVA